MSIKLDSKGSLLLEALIVISLLAIIVSLGSQLFLTSARSSKWSRETTVAQGLANETLEVIRAIAVENWVNLYRPPDGGGNEVTSKGPTHHYHVAQSGSSWVVANGDEAVTLDGLTFTRYFTLENVSRDPSSKSVQTSYSATNDDPSTQKIISVVSWPNAEPLVMSEYITRWRNKVCAQTDWSGGANPGVADCPNTTYGSANTAEVDTSGGSLKLKQQ